MLTGKQKHFLRSRAMTMKPLVNVGKNGLSDHLVQSVADAVESRELVKVSLLQTSDYGPKEVGAYLQQALPGLEIAQTIGRMVVVYKVAANADNRHLSEQVDELGR
ncbi:YhbY family RNA-binding protein [Lacticaseibacillus pantheris]|jgi:RNA-binding protein|nr:YhbY family RNA-binding protein [Lacticaseibacillus pantheris]WKF84557.1 YhbY family RNA-binding protein [Lacticaseibacillus pantheris]